MSAVPRIAKLIIRQLRGDISIQDLAELQNWSHASPDNLAFLNSLSLPALVKDSLDCLKIFLEMDEAAIERKLAAKMQSARVNGTATSATFAPAAMPSPGFVPPSPGSVTTLPTTPLATPSTSASSQPPTSAPSKIASSVHPFSWLFPTAASLTAIALFLWLYYSVSPTPNVPAPPLAKDNVRPHADGADATTVLFNKMPVGEAMAAPTRKARITFSDGQWAAFDDIPVGQAIEKDGWRIQRTHQHSIAYLPLQGASPGSSSGSSPISSPGSSSSPGSTSSPGSSPIPSPGTASPFHTFSIPFGQTWELSLPDGFQVQLNTGSSLAYLLNTSADNGRQRLLTLEGEALFHIATNADLPSVVKTRFGLVTVLGTSFNLRDYGKDNSFRATLVKGVIRVSNGVKNTILKPGEEAKIDKGTSAMTVAGVDTTKSLSWRRPYFEFTGKNIQQVMQQVVDWYGMEKVVFRGKVDTLTPGLLGGGQAARDLRLPTFLKMIQPEYLRFTIEGKSIIVSAVR